MLDKLLRWSGLRAKEALAIALVWLGARFAVAGLSRLGDSSDIALGIALLVWGGFVLVKSLCQVNPTSTAPAEKSLPAIAATALVAGAIVGTLLAVPIVAQARTLDTVADASSDLESAVSELVDIADRFRYESWREVVPDVIEGIENVRRAADDIESAVQR